LPPPLAGVAEASVDFLVLVLSEAVLVFVIVLEILENSSLRRTSTITKHAHEHNEIQKIDGC
jgi:hypothetical protein